MPGLCPGWGLRCHGILLCVAPGQEFTPGTGEAANPCLHTKWREKGVLFFPLCSFINSCA